MPILTDNAIQKYTYNKKTFKPKRYKKNKSYENQQKIFNLTTTQCPLQESTAT